MPIRQKRREAARPRPPPSHRGQRPLLAQGRMRVPGDIPRPVEPVDFRVCSMTGAIMGGTGTVTPIGTAIGTGDGTVTIPGLQRPLDLEEAKRGRNVD